MTFTELPFWIMAGVVYALWLCCRKNYRAKLWLLFVSSLVFYGYHRWELIFLLLAYCFVDWGIGCWIVRTQTPRLVLGLGVAFNLLVLGFWKYTPMLWRTYSAFASGLGWSMSAPPSGDWLIPFGISFYAFTGIAYMVDVYRRLTPAETSLLRYTVSALFFPHLVAGPILRPGDFLTRLGPATMPESAEAPLEAVSLLAQGFFKKMVLADRIALAVDPFFLHVGDSSTAGVWSLPYVYLYALQIYFDFSGYTDIARGLGLLFGFRWPENFHLPYLAESVQDFWRRWHITLSLFLRDYLYRPLGGNRKGWVRTLVNLLLTMLLGGLWHGASWSFMTWGGLHGGFLIVNRLWSRTALAERLGQLAGFSGTLWRLICVGLTFHSVCLAWCFFRLTVFADSCACVRKVFSFDADKRFAGGSSELSLWILLAIYGAMVWLAYRIRVPSFEELRRHSWATPAARGFLWGFNLFLLLLAVLLSPQTVAQPFIYFQF